MKDELEEWMRNTEATIRKHDQAPEALYRRLRYVAAIIADAGILPQEPSLLYRNLEHQVVLVKIGKRLVVGRQKPALLMFSEDMQLSRQHFSIMKEALGSRLKDLSSSNGTFVNRARVTYRILRDGDIVTAGDQLFVFLQGARD